MADAALPLFAALIAACLSAGCDSTALTGGAADASGAGAGGGSGGGAVSSSSASSSASAVVSSAVSSSASSGSSSSGGAPGAEQVASIDHPLLLRMGVDSVFVGSGSSPSTSAIERIAKVGGGVTEVTAELVVLHDFAVAGDTIYLSQSDTPCAAPCLVGSWAVQSVPVAGGSPMELGFGQGGYSSRVAPGSLGLYTTDAGSGAFRRVEYAPPFSYVTLFGNGFTASEIAFEGGGVFLQTFGPGVIAYRYDEAGATFTGISPMNEDARLLRVSNGVVHWIAGGQPSVLRRAENLAAQTLWTAPGQEYAYDVADSGGDAFVLSATPMEGADVTSRIWRVPLAGGPASLVADGLPPAAEIEADETHLYWIQQGSPGSVWRMPIPP